MKQEIFSSIVCDKLGYYVYCLADPRTHKIFYIGKGKGNRVFAHAFDALKSTQESDKMDLIRQIIAAEMNVEYYILRHNLKSEDEAYLVESVLIDLLTYPNFNKEDILTNIQGGHHSNEDGIMSVKDIQARYFDYPELVLQNGDRLLLVNITNSYYKTERSLMDSTREFWVVSKDKAAKTDYVLGVYNGIVMEVCKVKGHKFCDYNENGVKFDKPRVSFEVDELTESPYLHKKIPSEFVHSQNPVRYMPDTKEW